MKKYPVLTSVEVVGDYKLRLEFNDGVVRDHDMSKLVGGPGVWKPLADPVYFAQVRIDVEGDTVVWPNGADICPDILHGDVDAPVRNHESLKDADR